MKNFASIGTELAESGYIPDSVVRVGIRRLVAGRRSKINTGDGFDEAGFVRMMDRSPVALVPDLANQQHYEVPAEFFSLVLGEHCKYSCSLWSTGASNLDEAEAAALKVTCERANIADGQEVLDLGCGWGSLSLWIASNYPNSRVTAVSNSQSQRTFIERQASRQELTNLTVITADMNDFVCDSKFDRVVSVEMFEHLRNYREMFTRIDRWLKPGGYFFMHIFTHRDAAYEFVDNGPADWMSRHFFSGGIMPSANLPLNFQEQLVLDRRWSWSGIEYQRTAEAWLENMLREKASIEKILANVYGDENVRKWWSRWKIFFLAVSEMFGSNGGDEWEVTHYLFRPRPD